MGANMPLASTHVNEAQKYWTKCFFLVFMSDGLAPADALDVTEAIYNAF